MTLESEPGGMSLFITDDEAARRIRAVAAELRVVASRRRCFELAAELDQVARLLDPHGVNAA